MPFITQTPISDQIQNGQLPSSYSAYDTTGKLWDTLSNWNITTNIKPSDAIGPIANSTNTSGIGIAPNYSAYDTTGKLWDSLENHSNVINIKPSDAISRIGIAPNYSAYDTTGELWDSLSKYDIKLNIKPSDAISPTSGRIISNYSEYDIDASRKSLKFIGPTRTPITNQIDSATGVINKEDFSLYDTTGLIQTTLINNNVSAAVTTGVSKSRFLRNVKYSELKQSNFIGLDIDSGRYNAFLYTGTLTTVNNPKEKYDTIYRNTNLGGQLLQGGLAQANGLISTNLGLSVNTSDISKAIQPQGSYESLNYDQLYSTRGLGTQDFRNFKTSGLGRLDGTTSAAISLAAGKLSAASTKLVSLNAAAIASAQLMNNIGHNGRLRTNGTYNLFNQQTYFGMGTQDEPGVLRNDFTAGSEATKVWGLNSKWTTPVALNAFPFRGDRVTVRDYVQNNYSEIYNWRSSDWQPKSNEKSDSNKGFARAITAISNTIGKLRNSNTKDFIKFYLTGKDVYPGSTESDDIFVFRANITALNDSFSPQWTPVSALGRADTNWIYSSFQRSIDLSFSVYATSRDEMRPMWRKLNYLSTYTMPEYDIQYPTYRGKYLRITIGDLFISQPAFITSLTYTLADQETTWEINIEEDNNMKQVPQKVEVQMGLQFIGNQIPRYQGQAYSLHTEEQYNSTGENNTPGKGNWLSDASRPPFLLSRAGLDEIEADATAAEIQQGLDDVNNFQFDAI